MIIFVIILTAVLTGTDQLLKFWAVNELAGTGVSKPFISIGSKEIINLMYTENTGAAFSMMSGKKWFTVGFTSVALVLFAFYMIKNYRSSKALMTVTAVVTAGGIGNLIDRIRLGYVVDYIEVRLFRFAIFNFADICVTVGMLALIVFIFIYESKNKAKEKTNG